MRPKELTEKDFKKVKGLYNCGHCPKKMNKLFNMKVHVLTVHYGEAKRKKLIITTMLGDMY